MSGRWREWQETLPPEDLAVWPKAGEGKGLDWLCKALLKPILDWWFLKFQPISWDNSPDKPSALLMLTVRLIAAFVYGGVVAIVIAALFCIDYLYRHFA